MTKHAEDTREAYRWYCTQCSAKVGVEDYKSIPTDCPECDYYHYGDMDCCIGEGFKAMLERTMLKPKETFCEKCGAEMDPIDVETGEICLTCRNELAKKWLTELGAKTANVPHGTSEETALSKVATAMNEAGKLKNSLASPITKAPRPDQGDTCHHKETND